MNNTLGMKPNTFECKLRDLDKGPDYCKSVEKKKQRGYR